MKPKTVFLVGFFFLAGILLLIVFPLWTQNLFPMRLQLAENGPLPSEAPIIEVVNSRFFAHQDLAGWQRAAIGIAAYIFMYINGILLLFFIPGRIRRISDEIVQDWKARGRLIAIGLLSFVAVCATVLVGFLAVFAAPFSLALMFVFLTGAWIGWEVVAFALGSWLSRKAGMTESNPLVSLGAGLLVLQVFTAIPLLGWFPMVVCLSLGTGAIVLTRFGSSGPWSLKELTDGKNSASS